MLELDCPDTYSYNKSQSDLTSATDAAVEVDYSRARVAVVVPPPMDSQGTQLVLYSSQIIVC